MSWSGSADADFGISLRFSTSAKANGLETHQAIGYRLSLGRSQDWEEVNESALRSNSARLQALPQE